MSFPPSFSGHVESIWNLSVWWIVLIPTNKDRCWRQLKWCQVVFQTSAKRDGVTVRCRSRLESQVRKCFILSSSFSFPSFMFSFSFLPNLVYASFFSSPWNSRPSSSCSFPWLVVAGVRSPFLSKTLFMRLICLSVFSLLWALLISKVCLLPSGPPASSNSPTWYRVSFP